MKVESVMALRSTPQWLTATTASLASTAGVSHLACWLPFDPPAPTASCTRSCSHPFGCSSPGSPAPHQTSALAISDGRPSSAQSEGPAPK